MSSKHILERKTHVSPKAGLRTSERRKIHAHLKISVIVNGVNKLIPGYAVNISETGIAAYVPAQLRIGDTVTVEFTFPRSSHTFSMQSIVRANTKFQYGMEFVGMNQATRDTLAQCCRDLIPEQLKAIS